MAIPVPLAGDPTAQTWAASVAQALNERRTMSAATQTGTSDTPATTAAWPSQNTKTITVPSWASQVFVVNKIGAVYPQTSDINVNVFLNIDGVVVETSQVAYQLNPSSRYDIVMMGTKDVTAKRGSNIVVMTTAVRLTGTGWVRADTVSRYTFDIDFRP